MKLLTHSGDGLTLKKENDEKKLELGNYFVLGASSAYLTASFPSPFWITAESKNRRKRSGVLVKNISRDVKNKS